MFETELGWRFATSWQALEGTGSTRNATVPTPQTVYMYATVLGVIQCMIYLI